MYSKIDKLHTLNRKAFTVTTAVEAFLDPLLVGLCLFSVLLYHGDRIDSRYILLALIAFSVMFPGDARLHERPRRVVRKKVIDWLIFAAILGALGYTTGYLQHFSREVLQTWLLVTPLVLIAGHELARQLVPLAMTFGGSQKTAVIAGCNDIGFRLAQSFRDDPYLGVTFKGFFDDRSRVRLQLIGDEPLLGKVSHLGDYVKQQGIDRIYLALPMATQPRIVALLDDLKDTTASIFFAPDIFVTDIIQGRMDSIGGVPLVAVCETPFSGLNGVIKRASDILLSLLILLLAAPVMLAIAFGVKWTSPGPVVFRQRRYGLDGQEIFVYKFRSMRVCEDGGAIVQARKNDARVTPLGAFLRRTSLDELPQFVNVLQGRMSIVGPRPHAVAHNEMYRKVIKGYMVRHKVKPGITGWAQVNGCRGETDTVDKMEARVAWDLEYLRTWSPSLDLWIVFKTVWVVFRGDRHAY